MRNRLAAAIAAAALSVVLGPGRADACWCGYSGSVGDVSITEPMPNEDWCPVAWDPAVVREWATWLVRIDQVLAPGMRLESFEGEATVTTTTGRPRAVAKIAWGGDFEVLFAAMARLGADRDRARRARELAPQVFTVQVLATRTEQKAERVSARIGSDRELRTGFFWAGEAPADNPAAHVVSETDASGRTLHKVMIGAFLERGAAEASARVVEQRTGLRTFVRRL